LDELMRGRQTRALAAVALVGVPLLALVTYDLTSHKQAAQHFIWLFSYDYINTPKGRPWPEELNYIPAFLAFAGLFAVSTLGLGFRRLQRAATAALCVAAVAFTFYLLDVYMRQVSGRWSQKPLIASYYRLRRSPSERLIAWQMYWRGENFYTKNEI